MLYLLQDITLHVVTNNHNSLNHHGSKNADIMGIEAFCKIPVPVNNRKYAEEQILPKLFMTMDSKKDNFIDIEEYVSAIVLFRMASLDDKIKVIYLMYECHKSGSLMK